MSTKRKQQAEPAVKLTGDRRDDATTEAVPRIALRADEAAAALGISTRSLWELTSQGLVPHVKLGGCVVYPMNVLREWLAKRAADGREEKAQSGLRAKEAAAALGISTRSLWALTNQRLVPHVKLGSCVVYPMDALREWMAKQAMAGVRMPESGA